MSGNRTAQNLHTQKRLRKRLVILGAFAGISIGSLGSLAFVVWSDSDRSKGTASESIEANQNTNALRESKIQHGHATELSKLSETSSMVEMVSEFDRLSNEQIAELTQQSNDLESHSKLTSVRTVLLGELSRRDPQRALEQVWSFPSSLWKDLIAVVFSEWALSDVEESFAASMELNATLRETAVRSLLNTTTQLSNENWLTLADEHGFQESMLTLLREREAIALLDTPVAAFQRVIQDDVDDQLQGDLIQNIARTMIQQIGYDSFDSLLEYSVFGFRDLLMEEAESNPAAFFSVVQSLSPDSRIPVIYPLVEAWVPIDPNAAYEAVSSLEEFKARFYYTQIFRVWAENDLEGLFARVESFPRSERESAARSGIVELAKHSPEEAANRTFDYESVIGVDVFDLQVSVIREWAESDPKAAMNWVKENTSEDTWDQAWLLYNGLVEFVKTDPETALELALSQAPESVYVERGLVERVVSDVVGAGDLDLAMAALDRIPENARFNSFTSIGSALAVERRWQEAIDLIEGFSDEDQGRYFNSLTYSAMRDDLFELIETVPKLPTAKVRRQVAQGMLANQESFGDFLTADQISYLRRFVDQNE